MARARVLLMQRAGPRQVSGLQGCALVERLLAAWLGASGAPWEHAQADVY